MFQSLGKYVKAEEISSESSCDQKKKTADKQGEATDYGNLGNVFYSMGEYGKAVEYSQKALVITKEIGDKTKEASCYGNLGTVFQSLGEYVKAEEYHRKSTCDQKKKLGTNKEKQQITET